MSINNEDTSTGGGHLTNLCMSKKPSLISPFLCYILHGMNVVKDFLIKYEELIDLKLSGFV